MQRRCHRPDHERADKNRQHENRKPEYEGIDHFHDLSFCDGMNDVAIPGQSRPFDDFVIPVDRQLAGFLVHDQGNEIEQIATKVLIIDKGKKIKEGLATELFDPSSSLIELTTTQNERCRDNLLNSNWKDFLVISEHESIFLKMNKQSVPALNRYLVEQNIEVLSLQPRNSLEDYFLSVTTGNQHVEAFSN